MILTTGTTRTEFRDRQMLHRTIATELHPERPLWALSGDTLIVAASKPVDGLRLFRSARAADMPLAHPIGTRLVISGIINPVVQRAREGRRSSKHRLAPDLVPDWLRSRIHGADVEDVDVEVLRPIHGLHGEHRITICPVGVTATATVTDPAALADVLAAGVGSARAYGCGLLLAVPL